MASKMFVRDDTILGIGIDFKLYYRESMNDPWVKAPDKGGQVTSVAITAQGKILGVGKDSKLYFRDSLDDPWVRAPNDSGSLKGVAVARDGTILGIGMDNKIWTRQLENFASNDWVKAPDKGGWIKAIAVYHNGRILAVGRDNNLYTRANLNTPWKAAAKRGQVTDVCVLKDRTVVGIGMNKKLFTRAPNLNQKWNTTPDKGGMVIAITSHPWRNLKVGGGDSSEAVVVPEEEEVDEGVNTPDGEGVDPLDDVEEAVLVDADDEEPTKDEVIVKYNGILAIDTDYNLCYRETMSDPWVKVSERGQKVNMTGIGITLKGQIIGVSVDNKLYFRNNLDSPWVKAADNGLLKKVAVTRDGIIYGIGMDNKIWTRELEDFANKPWLKAPDKGGWIKAIAVYNNGRILACGRNNKLYTRATLRSAWKSAPNTGGQVTDICILKDRTVIGIGRNKKLFTRSPNLRHKWEATPDQGGTMIAITSHPWRGNGTDVTEAIEEESLDPLHDIEEFGLEEASPEELNHTQFSENCEYEGIVVDCSIRRTILTTLEPASNSSWETNQSHYTRNRTDTKTMIEKIKNNATRLSPGMYNYVKSGASLPVKDVKVLGGTTDPYKEEFLTSLTSSMSPTKSYETDKPADFMQSTSQRFNCDSTEVVIVYAQQLFYDGVEISCSIQSSLSSRWSGMSYELFRTEFDVGIAYISPDENDEAPVLSESDEDDGFDIISSLPKASKPQKLITHDGWFNIKSRKNLYLCVKNNNAEAGKTLTVSLNNNIAGALWKWDGQNIISKLGSEKLFIGVASNSEAKGADVVLVTKREEDGQRWTIEGDRIKSRLSGFYMATKDNGGHGSEVHVWIAEDSDGQHWAIPAPTL